MEEKKSKNIKRIMSGLIGFPIIAIILIFSNDLVMDIALAVISIIGTYEFFKCFKSKEKANPSKWYAMIISALMIFTHTLSNEALKEILIAIIPISLLVLTIELIVSKEKKNIIDIAIVYTIAEITAPKTPATQPSIVLLGLILVNLCLPHLFPIKYANTSLPQEARITYHIIIFPFINLPLIMLKKTSIRGM